jgi:two-component system response regulator QseB/two-component system response regulator TctD
VSDSSIERLSSFRIVVVEDERKIREAIAQAIRLEGWQAIEVGRGQEVEPLLRKERFDLVVLDWMLPDGDGLSLLGKIRELAGTLPILMLTARGSTEDRVIGLDAGADDYLAKPFSIVEMMARCRALLRRPQRHATPILQCGSLRLNVQARTAHRGGEEIGLSPQETNVLECLIFHQREVVSRQILERLLCRRASDEVPNKMLDVVILRLRRKLEPDGTAKMIQTLRGIGYRLTADGA